MKFLVPEMNLNCCSITRGSVNGARWEILAVLLIACAVNAGTAPADTLLNGLSVKFSQKLLIAPIAAYQRISYATPLLACQYEPSCSHYMALSIADNGIGHGVLLGTDRIVRCHPFNLGKFINGEPDDFHTDGRLLDPPVKSVNLRNPGLEIFLPIVPGMGRVRKGQIADGAVNFLLVVAGGSATIRYHQYGYNFVAAVSGLATMLFWASDFHHTMRADL